MKKKLVVKGMSCGHCVHHVQEALLELEGITSAQVDLDSATAIIEGADVADDAIKDAIDEAGYEVTEIETL